MVSQYSWDSYYARDLQNLQDPSDSNENEHSTANPNFSDEDDDDSTAREGWFSDVNAPQKILRYLISSDFPLSPSNIQKMTNTHWPTVLDVGTGNGSMLFLLRDEPTPHAFSGSKMVGIDYSAPSVQLARKIAAHSPRTRDIEFKVHDIFQEGPEDAEGVSWWEPDGWDIVLDKGTFDAISLSSETVRNSDTGKDVRICELYPERVTRLVKKGGYLVVTSCNWTEEEVVRWFVETPHTRQEVRKEMEVSGRIKYSRFKFGGAEGQGVCTVCFQRKQ